MSILENLQTSYHAIDRAAHQWKRSSSDINLVAVSKLQPPENIRYALSTGHRLFGENRVQEAYKHWQEHIESGLYPDLKLHLIGPLQSNKVKDAVELFNVIETLDHEKLAKKLATAMKNADKNLSCFIQVNTGQEPQKSGIAPLLLPEFLSFCRDECGLSITGLMCIPPLDDPPSLHFALLRKLAVENNLEHLSMGMSRDFEDAIANGATYIRLGTKIFGPRLYSN